MMEAGRIPRVLVCNTWKEDSYMNSTGKFLVSALLVHAANLKKTGEIQTGTCAPIPSLSVNNPLTPQAPAGK